MRIARFLPAALLVCGLHAPAQQTAPSTAAKADLSVEARLVIVPAVVRDKHNALVSTLKLGDFALQIDGKSQNVRYFDHDSDVPLTLGLLIDTSMSQRTVLDDERTASSAFLEKMLTPNRDKAFIVQFAHTVELLQDVTDSRPKLQQALKEVDSPKPSFQQTNGGDNGDQNGGDNNNNDRRGRGRDALAGAGTALYDAVFLASDEVLAKHQGRRAIILLTDGDDRGSKVTLARAIESAQHANTIVYAIYYKGERPRFDGGRGGGFPGGGQGRRRGGGFPFAEGEGGGQMGGGRGGGNQVDGKKVLERMCGETGGRVFEVNKKLTVDAIYTQIAEELRAQYRLGFTPSAEAAADGYHQIALTLIGPEAKNKSTVQTRDGYYTGASK
jgi:VWFA-related protein